MIRPKDLVRLGLYRNEREAVEDGIRHLLLSHPEYRVEIAVERYKREEISLGKAAQLAGLSLEEMKELLKDRGIPLKGPEILEEIHTDAEQARKALWK
jgi:predicted HTH domain antitoxin